MYEKSFVSGIHPSRMLSRFTDLWLSKSLCDATIEAGPVKVYVHRLVLFSVCPSLMQIKEYESCSRLEIRLPTQITTDALNAFLHFCYTSVLPLSISNVNSVEHLAQIFKVDIVLKFCKSYKSALRKSDVHESMLSTISETLPVVVSVCQEENVTKISFLDTKSELKENEKQSKGDVDEIEMLNKEFKNSHLPDAYNECETKIKNENHFHVCFTQTSKKCESLPGVDNRKQEHQTSSGYGQHQQDLQMKARSRSPVSQYKNDNERNSKDHQNYTNNAGRPETYDETFCSERKSYHLHDTKPKKQLVMPSTVLLRNDTESTNNSRGPQKNTVMLSENSRSLESDKWSVKSFGNRFKDITNENCYLGKGLVDFDIDVNMDESTYSFTEFSELVDEYMNMDSPLKYIEPTGTDAARDRFNCTKTYYEASGQESRQDDESTGKCSGYSTGYSDGELHNVSSRELNYDLNSNELQLGIDESSQNSFQEAEGTLHTKENELECLDTEKSHVCQTPDRECNDQKNCDTPTVILADKKEVIHKKSNVARKLKFCKDDTQKQCLEKPMDLKIVKVTSLAGMKKPNYTCWIDKDGDVEYSQSTGLNTLSPKCMISGNDVDFSSLKNYASCHKELEYRQPMSIKKWGVKIFKEWLLKHGKPAEFEMMPLAAINSLLEEFYTQVQIKDDSDFSFSALKAIKQCLTRYLNDSPYKRNVKFSKQEEFRSSTRVYKRIYKQCRRKAKRLNNTNPEIMVQCPISANDFLKLYCSRALSNDNPHSLQRKVIFEVLLHMKTVKNPCALLLELTKSSFKHHLDDIGRRFYTVTSKCHLSNSNQVFYIYEKKNKSICPVQSLDIYLSKLARENNAFIQKAVNRLVTVTDREWYLPQKLAKSTIKGFMAKLSEFAGLSRIYTFSSMRKTSLLLEKLDSLECQGQHFNHAASGYYNPEKVIVDKLESKCLVNPAQHVEKCDYHTIKELVNKLNKRDTKLHNTKANVNELDTQICSVKNLKSEQRSEHHKEYLHMVKNTKRYGQDMQRNTPETRQEFVLKEINQCDPRRQHRSTKQKYIDRVLYSIDKDGKVTIQKTTGQRNEKDLCVDEFNSTDVDSMESNMSVMNFHSGFITDNPGIQSTKIGLYKEENQRCESQCGTRNYRIYKDGEQIKPLDLSTEPHNSDGKHTSTRRQFTNKCAGNNFSCNFPRYVPPKKRRHEIPL